jgi:hypothetical protein
MLVVRTGLHRCQSTSKSQPFLRECILLLQEAHTRVRSAREAEGGESKEKQTVHICAIPLVVSEVDSLAHRHSVPRSKYPLHRRPIRNYNVLYVIDDPQ